MVATLSYEAAQSPGVPVHEAELDYDEMAFIHSADPAALTIVTKGSAGLSVYWRSDARPAPNAAISYAIYRRVSGGTLAFFRSSTAASGVNHVDDATLAPANQTVCYQVRTVDSTGAEHAFSFEACRVLLSTADASSVTYVNATITSKTCPSDTSKRLSWACDATHNRDARTQCFCTVTYAIQGQFVGADITRPELEVWGYTPGPLTNATSQCGSYDEAFFNQCRQPFKLLSVVALSKSGFSLSGSVTRQEPLIAANEQWRRADLPTEMVVLRLRANNGSLLYPKVGYLTMQKNNRIRDRLWAGLNMNPANPSWALAIAKAAQPLRAQGYTTIQLDEFRSLKPSMDAPVGANHEAPAIEYPYPAGYTTDPTFVDQWTTSLVAFSANLRTYDSQLRASGAPPMLWIGNTLGGYAGSSPLEQILRREQLRAITNLDEAILEGCIVGGKVAYADAAWAEHLRVLDEVGALGKRALCLASPPYGKTDLALPNSSIDKDIRLYSLASFLLANEQSLVSFGHWEIDPSARPGTYPSRILNDFVEYHTNLGSPRSKRVSKGTQCLFREFANGAVAVNGSSTATCAFDLRDPLNPIQLVSPIKRRADPLDPGDAILGTTQAKLSLQPHTGTILLRPGISAPEFPRAYFSNVSRSSHNADAYTDVYIYNTQSGANELRYGQPRDGAWSAFASEPIGPASDIVPGDFNGDGATDILIYNPSSGAVEIRYGQPTDGLRLAVVTKDTWSPGHKLVPGDFNGDGYTDILVYNSTNGSTEIRYGGPTDGLRFAPTTKDRWSLGHAFTIGDYNGDGCSDVLIYNTQNGGTEIRYGQPADGLRFAPTTQDKWSLGHTLVPGDYNGDGYADVLIYNTQNGGTEIRYGKVTDGLRFAATTQDAWSLGHRLTLGDFNGDGFMDVFIYGSNGGTEIRYGQSVDGLRSAPASKEAWSLGYTLAAGDFNGDGYTDVLVYDIEGYSAVRYGQAGDGLRRSTAGRVAWGLGYKLITGPTPMY